MKYEVADIIKKVANDRPLIIAMSIFMIICFGMLVFLAFGITPSERQVAVHYTSYGTTNFYRDSWMYLLSFAVFALVIAAIHSIITLKILAERGRELALAFAWMSVIVGLIVTAYLLQILKIASII